MVRGALAGGKGTVDILLEALRAVGSIVAVAALIFIAPLIFMLVFSLVSGFTESQPAALGEEGPAGGRDERVADAPADERQVVRHE